MQMLEKYADEEDDEQADEYYGTEGVNYAFLYDSPFNSSNDRQIFLQKIVIFLITKHSLSNVQANALLNSLNAKNKKRLQLLFN